MPRRTLPRNIHHPEFECMDREDLRELQTSRLKAITAWCYERVPFYRGKMDQAGVKPTDIRCLEDIRLLPFTTKDDLRENYPFGLFAVPREELLRVHTSSGTTGNPTVVGYTREDLNLWSELCARFITAAGVTDRDMVQIAFGYGLFTGGFGLHYGIERVGAAIIPASSGNTRRQVKLMKDFGVTVLVCTPSYSLHIADTMREMGVNPADLNLRIGLFGAEPWSEQMRRKIETALDIHATDNYGLSEIIGPGVSGECLEKNGMHIQEDHFLTELLDSETGETISPDSGRRGELVITTLTKKALPMLRYRTKDLTRLSVKPCPCGRTTARMEKIGGRTDDMLIIRGVNVFPSQIESVLLDMEHVEPHYEIIVDRQNNLDRLEVQVEVSGNLFHDEMRRLHEHHLKLKQAIESTLGLDLDLKLVEPWTIARSEGKARRVTDKRSL